MPIIWDDLYNFSGSDSEPTSGRSSWKRKKSQAFPLAISYGGFFPSDASMSVLADEQRPTMIASSSQAVDHTALGAPTNIEDHSSVGEG